MARPAHTCSDTSHVEVCFLLPGAEQRVPSVEEGGQEPDTRAPARHPGAGQETCGGESGCGRHCSAFTLSVVETC